MPYSNAEARKAYQRELMRKRRAEFRAKDGSNRSKEGTNNPDMDHSSNVSPANSKMFQRIESVIVGDELQAECPICGFMNSVDRARSFRPVRKCDHFQQLVVPGKWSDFLFRKGFGTVSKGLTGLTKGLTGSNFFKESIDGISWKTVSILTKDQAFECNNVVVLGTWHKGSVKEADAV